MKVFNEEKKGKGGDAVIIFTAKEAQKLLAMAEAACSSCPRMKTWKAILNDLQEKVACW